MIGGIVLFFLRRYHRRANRTAPTAKTPPAVPTPIPAFVAVVRFGEDEAGRAVGDTVEDEPAEEPGVGAFELLLDLVVAVEPELELEVVVVESVMVVDGWKPDSQAIAFPALTGRLAISVNVAASVKTAVELSASHVHFVFPRFMFG